MFEPGFIERRSQALLDTYVQLVADIFPGVITLEEFTLAFNETFTSYQKSSPRKMAPESLLEGNVTCSSAAAILGVWWELTSGNIPWYFIDRLDGQSKASSHITSGLRLNSNKPDDANSEYSQFIRHLTQNSPNRNVEFFDYLAARGLGVAELTPETLPTTHIRGTKPFLQNRVKTFGLKSKLVKERETRYASVR